MVDTVTSQTIVDGGKIVVMSFTNASDGTGEADVVKVDVSELADIKGPNGSSTEPTNVKIRQIWYSTVGMSVRLLWEASADVLAFVCPADQNGYADFRSFDGLKNNAGTGVTGDIGFTTTGHSSGDSYHIVLELSKS